MSDKQDRIEELPVWRGRISYEPLLGGLTNESFLVSDSGERLVVRFGRDLPFHHVSRERETMAAKAAFEAGLAPEVIYAGPGVMVSRFVEAKTYAPEDLRANLERVADIVARFHRALPQKVSGPGFIFWVFHVIRDYARTLEAGKSRMLPRLPGFLALSAEFEAAQIPLPIVYGHHDLLPANFLDDGERLWLIDFEYAGYSTPLFDLASVASNAHFSPEESETLLTRYFGAAPGAALLQAQAAMQCASLLREAMWSMVSELHMTTPGIDYPAYTAENLGYLDRALDSYRSRYGKAS